MAAWRVGLRSLTIAAMALSGGLAACGPSSDSGPAYPLISLERTACLGSCPDYVVTIDGRGTVTFSTDAPAVDQTAASAHRLYFGTPAVLMPGRHTDHIAPSAVQALAERFEAIGFFGLNDIYASDATDLPTFKVSIDTGQRRKEVVDYWGSEAGMPESVSKLEDEIDRVAGTARWVDGADGLVAWLAKTNFDFKSNIAAMLLANGSGDFVNADERTLVELVERGAPLDLVIAGGRSYQEGWPIGSEVMWNSILTGRGKLFASLRPRGWLEKLGLDEAADAFARGAGGCNPDFVDVAANAGVDIDAAPMTRLDGSYQDKSTALAHLGPWRPCDDDSAKRVQTAARLIARGANPNKRGGGGKTALFEVYDLALLNFLLAHGADPTAKDNEGNSAAFSTSEDDIVARLLEAGADPNGKFYEGKTLAEQVKDGKMPLTESWLAKHDAARKAPH